MATLRANGEEVARLKLGGLVRVIMSNGAILRQVQYGSFNHAGKMSPPNTFRDVIDMYESRGWTTEIKRPELLDAEPTPVKRRRRRR